MLAGGGMERQVEKRPNLTTSKNTERQTVLPPSASDCHSVPKWLSSPSRVGHNPRNLRGIQGFCKRVTQNVTHSPIRTTTHEAAVGSLEPRRPRCPAVHSLKAM